MLRLRVTAPVESVGDVYHAVSGCKRLSEEFTADGSIVLRVAVELGQVSYHMVAPHDPAGCSMSWNAHMPYIKRDNYEIRWK